MTIQWKLETLPLKLLKNHSKNPREISKEQLQHLETLIDKFGLIDKPIVNQDYTIIGGHQRIRILKKRREKFVECWVPDQHIDENDLDHLCIGLNLNQGRFDYDILANEFDMIDLLKWGFTEEQLVGSCKDIENNLIEESEKKSNKKCKECPNCGHEF